MDYISPTLLKLQNQIHFDNNISARNKTRLPDSQLFQVSHINLLSTYQQVNLEAVTYILEQSANANLLLKQKEVDSKYNQMMPKLTRCVLLY